jgi:hypothetical protein
MNTYFNYYITYLDRVAATTIKVYEALSYHFGIPSRPNTAPKL